MNLTTWQANVLYGLALLIGAGKPFVYWLFHPELSHMQVWQMNFWWWFTACIIILVTYGVERLYKQR